MIKNETLENHAYLDTDMFRLRYYRSDDKHLFTDNYSFDTFVYPDSVSRSDSHKLISYIVKEIEKNNKDKNTYKVLKTVNKVLPYYGFFKLPGNGLIKPVDLFVVEGNIDKFKNSRYYKYYFNWYTEDYELDDIIKIFNKINGKENLVSKQLLKRR